MTFTVKSNNLLLLLVVLLTGSVRPAGADVTLENGVVRWRIGSDGNQQSFVVKASGKDWMAPGAPFPIASVHDARGWHAAISIAAAPDNLWLVEFADNAGSIQLRAKAERDHFFIELASAAPQGVDRIVFAQVSLNIPRETVGGSWPLGEINGLHVVWAPLSPYVRNSYETSRATVFKSEALEVTGFNNARVAILTTPVDQTLKAIEDVIKKYNLPYLTLGGVWFHFSDELRQPYLFTDLTEANVEEVIRHAKRAKLGYVLTSRGAWSAVNGHFEIDLDKYPHGLDGLKSVADKLHSAGIKFGIHLMSANISPTDSYVSPVPDKRLAVARTFTLTKDLDAKSKVVHVDSSPAGMNKFDVYASPGCDLWIEDEIIGYSDYTTEVPFQFTECNRGKRRTTPSAHKAGATVRYLQRWFNLYPPDSTTDLLPEIAGRIADICNTCGVDMLYFDGAYPITRNGRPWHDLRWVQREVAKRLKREVLMVGSGGGRGFSLYTHMRGVTNDGVSRASKAYLDKHKIRRIKNYRLDLVETEIGWLNLDAWDISHPPTQPDEWEYFCHKGLAYDSPVSMNVRVKNLTENGRAMECLDIIGRYEEARKEGKFSPQTMFLLKEPGKEFELVGNTAKGWGFRRTKYGPQRLVCSDMPEATTWKIDNPFQSQPLALRLRVRPALQPYGHQENVVLLGPGESVDWDIQGLHGAECSVEISQDITRDGAPSLKLTGHATSARRGSRAWASKEFKPRPDIRGARSLGVWIHGDSGGELLDLQLVDPSMINCRDHLIPIDFHGWRYFRFVDAAAEETLDYDLFRFKGALRSFDYGAVRELRLQLAAMPLGKEVTVHVGRIEALTEIRRPLVTPVLEVNGNRLALPWTIEPDEMIELSPDGECILFTKNNDEKSREKIGNKLPVVKSDENTIRLSATGPMPFTYVTPILRSEKVLR